MATSKANDRYGKKTIVAGRRIVVGASQSCPGYGPRFTLVSPACACAIPAGRVITKDFSVLSRIVRACFDRPSRSGMSSSVSRILVHNIVADLHTTLMGPRSCATEDGLV